MYRSIVIAGLTNLFTRKSYPPAFSSPPYLQHPQRRVQFGMFPVLFRFRLIYCRAGTGVNPHDELAVRLAYQLTIPITPAAVEEGCGKEGRQ